MNDERLGSRIINNTFERSTVIEYSSVYQICAPEANELIVDFQIVQIEDNEQYLIYSTNLSNIYLRKLKDFSSE